MQALGPPSAIVVDALSYLASAFGIVVGRPGRPPSAGATVEDAPPGRRGRLTQGLRLLYTNPYLRALTVHAAVYNLASQILTINLVLWLVQGREVSPGAYGLALSAEGVGAVLGTLTALQLAERLGFGRAFAVSLLLSCVVPLLLAALPLSGTALAVAVGAILLVGGIGLGNAPGPRPV